MSQFFNTNTVRNLFAAAVVAGALGMASTANAGDYCHAPAPRCYWKTIKTYELIEKPCVHFVTKYDHCGHPYQVKVVTYETVRVPVFKEVKVCY